MLVMETMSAGQQAIILAQDNINCQKEIVQLVTDQQYPYHKDTWQAKRYCALKRRQKENDQMINELELEHALSKLTELLTLNTIYYV